MLVKYNQENFDVDLIVNRIDPNDTSIFLEQARYALNLDFVSRMIIGNDLLNPVPFIQIDYLDKGNLNLEKYPADGRTILSMEMNALHTEGKKFDHLFIIDNIKILDKQSRENIIRIEGRSYIHPILQSKVDFSSGKDNEDSYKEYTKIAKDLLNYVKYPLNREGLETDHKNHFIAPANFTVNDCIDYLLSYSFSSTMGMFYLIYNMIDQQGKILSLKELFENFDPNEIPSDDIPTYNIFSIPSENGIISEYTATNNFISKNTIYGSSTYNLVSKAEEFSFDYITRNRLNNPYNFNRLKKILPSLPSSLLNDYEEIPKDIPKIIGQDLKFTEELPNLSFGRIYEKADILFKKMENVQFNCYGHLFRDVGNLGFIFGSNPVDAERYGGFWMIARIYHIFTRGNYISNITCVRDMKLEGPLQA